MQCTQISDDFVCTQSINIVIMYVILQPVVCVMILVIMLYGQYAVVLVLHHAYAVLKVAQ